MHAFEELPYFAQALVAIRMVRRAVLGKYEQGDAERQRVCDILDIAERCCAAGNIHPHKPLLKELMSLRDLYDARRSERADIRLALWWASDAVLAADASQDFAIDGTCPRSARSAIATLGEDRELNRVQISILLASDVDQMLFACGEVGKLPSKNIAARYEGVGSHVLGRLAPVHALTVEQYVPSGEDAAR